MTLAFPQSLWLETATPAEPSPELQGDINEDVAIVGAGFTGLRAALELANTGARVVVLDAGDVGWGASGRTGGQVNPMLPFNTPEQVRNRLGSKYFERLTDVSLNSADEVFELIRHYGIDCQARQNGWLRVDHCQKAQRVSLANAEIWNRYGADMVPVDSNEIVRLSGSHAYKSGIIAAKGGAVQPLSLARGLARLAREKGARICGNSPVSSLTETDKGWVLKTSRGRVTAQWVILATNAYTDDLCNGLLNSLMPLVSIQIATEPLDEQRIAPILPGGHTLSDTRRIIMYSRREPGNQLVFGGVGKIKSDGEPGGFKWLVKDAERIFPALKGVHWTYRWGGKLAVTADRLPHLHEPRKCLLAGLGYNGRGVAMSNVMGRILAERVSGAAAESLPFPVTDICKFPFRAVQMMGKGTAINWMRLLDRLES